MNCQAFKDRTGDWVCTRCGYYWDADDDAPPCHTDEQIINVPAPEVEVVIKKATQKTGKRYVNNILEDLKK